MEDWDFTWYTSSSMRCFGVILTALLLAPGCGKSEGTADGGARGDGAAAASASSAGPVDAKTARAGEDPWKAAESLDEDELARLAAAEGPDGLLEGAAADPKRAPLAARALAYTSALRVLPFLAERGAGDGDDAAAALESAVAIAALPRRAEDPEDAVEMRAGCVALLALAKNVDRPKKNRILAIRALRMLEPRGCVAAADIPKDFDPK